MNRLVVISNRVAVPKARGAAGAQGGLAGALNAALRKRGGIWFGWSGQECETFTGALNVQTSDDAVTTATIDLETQDIEEYYNGYANSTLWPLFHYRIDLTEYEREFGKGYERVNERFAEAVAPLIDADDQVWVHDYHLMPLADGLRARGLTNTLGFFLHIPWPATNLLVSLPYHERLVRALLSYDLIGFQTQQWLDSFRHYCGKELGLPVDEDSGIITFEGREVLTKAYPIGIDYEHFMAQGDSGEARQAAQRLISSTRHRTAMLGVDRLDYSKGLPERIDAKTIASERERAARAGIEPTPRSAIENRTRKLVVVPDLTTLLRDRQLVYIQIAPPSREDVGSYQKIRTLLEQKTGQINGARSEVDIVPIRYVNHGYSQAELYGFYRGSKIGLVTPLRDGMNLVAKEYIAAQDPEDPGVLILSRFAGAAAQLDCGGEGALLVNPHSADDMAHAIRLALDMGPAERKARWDNQIVTVREDNVHRWTDSFLADMVAVAS